MATRLLNWNDSRNQPKLRIIFITIREVVLLKAIKQRIIIVLKRKKSPQGLFTRKTPASGHEKARGMKPGLAGSGDAVFTPLQACYSGMSCWQHENRIVAPTHTATVINAKVNIMVI
ncbi:hypothetical protein H5P28_02295 [Ruficoccus amylovorans]|uniref:Uncharacterized protein n=1 Tax=Ruficoccus amylovorans TaxID=1804625 RepID=A0A842H9I8_9BACT|nr:hypothetical protein [Ruficoccus amylovorans]MBC2593082.1 hypothetical protein [Ruficoccus amylovorans]